MLLQWVNTTCSGFASLCSEALTRVKRASVRKGPLSSRTQRFLLVELLVTASIACNRPSIGFTWVDVDADWTFLPSTVTLVITIQNCPVVVVGKFRDCTQKRTSQGCHVLSDGFGPPFPRWLLPSVCSTSTQHYTMCRVGKYTVRLQSIYVIHANIRVCNIHTLFDSISAADLLFWGGGTFVRYWIQTYPWKALDNLHACRIVLWRFTGTAELYSSSKGSKNRPKRAAFDTGPSLAARGSAIAIAQFIADCFLQH
jgi:hypothetical protein